MTARESNVPPQEFMPHALPASTLRIYLGLRLAHSMLACTLGQHK